MSSRRRCVAAYSIASAATSGWKIGGTGCGCRGSFARPQSNCGVLSAGSWTIVTCTFEPSCSSSVRSDSVKPRIACFAPQYAAWSGMQRYASAEPTWTIVAAIARQHAPQRRHRSPDRAEVRDLGRAPELLRRDRSRTGAKTVAIALFTQTSIGPNRSSIWPAARSTSVGVGDVDRKCERLAAELPDLGCASPRGAPDRARSAPGALPTSRSGAPRRVRRRPKRP